MKVMYVTPCARFSQFAAAGVVPALALLISLLLIGVGIRMPTLTG